MSVMKELQSEIVRLARREVRKELAPVKRINATQRGLIANLRRELHALEREVARLRKAAETEGAVVPPKPEETEQRFWITGKGVISLRKRLGITQAELAKLAGVTPQTVVRWEKADGKIPFRQGDTADAMQQIRSMDKKTAMEKLGKES